MLSGNAGVGLGKVATRNLQSPEVFCGFALLFPASVKFLHTLGPRLLPGLDSHFPDFSLMERASFFCSSFKGPLVMWLPPWTLLDFSGPQLYCLIFSLHSQPSFFFSFFFLLWTFLCPYVLGVLFKISSM